MRLNAAEGSAKKASVPYYFVGVQNRHGREGDRRPLHPQPPVHHLHGGGADERSEIPVRHDHGRAAGPAGIGRLRHRGLELGRGDRQGDRARGPILGLPRNSSRRCGRSPRLSSSTPTTSTSWAAHDVAAMSARLADLFRRLPDRPAGRRPHRVGADRRQPEGRAGHGVRRRAGHPGRRPPVRRAGRRTRPPSRWPGRGIVPPTCPRRWRGSRFPDARRALALAPRGTRGAQPGTVVAVTGTAGKEFGRGLRPPDPGPARPRRREPRHRRIVNHQSRRGIRLAHHPRPGDAAPDPGRSPRRASRNSPWRRPRTGSSSGASTACGSRLRASPISGRDHLDNHASIEEYLTAKLRLFTDLLPDGCPRSSTPTAPMPTG